MLSGLSKALRIRAAIALCTIYAICILAAPAAFAFSSMPNLAHCLTEGHVAIAQHDHGATAHVHADGTAHQHHDDHAPPKSAGDSKGQVANCCGLFSTVAISADLDFTPEFAGRASVVLPWRCNALDGRPPERINRPPIALLSL
jgi:hypothetical protein